MDQCTHEIRMQHWKCIISQCQNRAEGQTAKQWMKENGICEQTYYFWQRRIRQEAFEQMNASPDLLPALPEKSDLSFAEISLPGTKNNCRTPDERISNPVAIIKTSGMTIALSADIPDGLLKRILREVPHA